MNITVTNKLAEAVGPKKLVKFGFSNEWSKYSVSESRPLAGFAPKLLDEFEELFADVKDVDGIVNLRRDIKTWRTVLEMGPGQARARSLEQFADLLTRYLDFPGHRVYARKYEDGSGPLVAYYVDEIKYYEKNRDHPAWVSMKMLYEEFGNTCETNESFSAEDVRGTVAECLGASGYIPETPELREEYLAVHEKFSVLSGAVGKQMLATGTATDDCDGNPDGKESWYWRRTHRINLDRSRAVLDIYYEDPKEEEGYGRRKRERHPDPYFWPRQERKNKSAAKARKYDDDDKFDNDDGGDVDSVAEVPVHPMLCVFDMARHLRLRVHVSCLSTYVYDETLADKLVLRDDLKALVRVLVEHRDGGWQDIVRGKSGGAVVLLAGPPGVGKTLTAEVYAESMKRPLYTVQCSQLGLTPQDLEDELLKVFARAARWKAILLLDEADVYVRERGSDLTQNAIVGVFLRVMEYQTSVLFLTTNRPQDVDDAIASRCVARVVYPPPTKEELARIWRVLADAGGANLPDEAIPELLKDGDSGRDVKNLLKLASLVHPGEPVSAAVVEFLRRFRPAVGPVDGIDHAAPIPVELRAKPVKVFKPRKRTR